MPKTPKSETNKKEIEDTHPSAVEEEVVEDETKNKKSYYYDDAYGYESYIPEREDSEEE